MAYSRLRLLACWPAKVPLNLKIILFKFPWDSSSLLVCTVLCTVLCTALYCVGGSRLPPSLSRHQPSQESPASVQLNCHFMSDCPRYVECLVQKCIRVFDEMQSSDPFDRMCTRCPSVQSADTIPHPWSPLCSQHWRTAPTLQYISPIPEQTRDLLRDNTH